MKQQSFLLGLFTILFTAIFFEGCGGGSDTKTTISVELNITLEPFGYQQWYVYKDDTFYRDNGIDDDAHIHAQSLLNDYSGKGITIAVIDNGLDITHEDLNGVDIRSFDSATKSTDVSYDDVSGAYHGTAVTGIIAAQANKKGIYGIANHANIIFLKNQDYMSDSEMIELFEKANAMGADIISCSWGTYNVSDAVRAEIIKLATTGRGGKGTLIVFANGNDDIDMGNDESNIAEVISVGASNKDNDRAYYSNYGLNLDILAPGGVYLGITTLDLMGSSGVGMIEENYILYNDYNAFRGTSASAPIVSAALALVLEKNPNLTRVEIENALHESADKIGTLPYIDGRNDYYGYGKINLEKLFDILN